MVESHCEFPSPFWSHVVLSAEFASRNPSLIRLGGAAAITYHMLVIADDFRYVFRACQPSRNKTTLWQVGVIKKWGTSQLSKRESAGRLFKCDIQYTCIFKFWIPCVMLIITPSSLTLILWVFCLSLSICKSASAGGRNQVDSVVQLAVWLQRLRS